MTTHSTRRAWAAVALLAVVGTLNYADRFLPAVLAEPIKNDLALSDTAIGVINGFWFLAVYAVLGLFIARIADRGAFGLVISTCLTLWGTMTMLGGAVNRHSSWPSPASASRWVRRAVRLPRMPTWRGTFRRNGAPPRWPSSPCRSR